MNKNRLFEIFNLINKTNLDEYFSSNSYVQGGIMTNIEDPQNHVDNLIILNAIDYEMGEMEEYDVDVAIKKVLNNLNKNPNYYNFLYKK